MSAQDPGPALREFRRLYAAGRLFDAHERAWSRLADAPEGDLGIDLSRCRAAHPALADSFARWDAGGERPDLQAPPIG